MTFKQMIKCILDTFVYYQISYNLFPQCKHNASKLQFIRRQEPLKKVH